MQEPFAELEAATRGQVQTAVERILAERFQDISQRHARELHRAERALSEQLNQTARRLRMVETAAEWRATLTEAAHPFCSRAAVLPATAENAALPAIATVIESKDTVVTLRDASQLSADLLASLGESTANRCYLFPVFEKDSKSESIVAVLYAEPGSGTLDRNALELLATMAWGTLPAEPASADGSETPGQAPVPGMVAGTPSRSVAAADASRHYAAQRFARVRVAEILMHSPAAVDRGRRDRRLYVYLKDALDAARREFRTAYLEPCASMADYLHQEVVHRLAHDDAALLGTEYPDAIA